MNEFKDDIQVTPVDLTKCSKDQLLAMVNQQQVMIKKESQRADALEQQTSTLVTQAKEAHNHIKTVEGKASAVIEILSDKHESKMKALANLFYGMGEFIGADLKEKERFSQLDRESEAE